MEKQTNIKEESIKYTKFICNTELGTEIKIRATIKEINTNRFIVTSEHDDILPCIEVPQNILFKVICYEGLYKADSKLTSYFINDNIYTWYIDMPKSFDFKQDRAFFRVTKEFDCDYIFEIEGNLKSIKAKTIDISANGVSIFLPIKLISHKKNELNLYINDKKIKLELDFMREEKIASGYKLSFKYKNVNAKDIDYISATCIKQQLEERRNSFYKKS